MPPPRWSPSWTVAASACPAFAADRANAARMRSLDLFRLDGRAAVVMGGAGGLGAATARRLAEAGAGVAIADANAGQAKTAADALTADGLRALALAVDVTDQSSVEDTARDAEARLGPVDVLVNSAGITHRGPAADFPAAQWHRVRAVTLTGVFRVRRGNPTGGFLACQVFGRGMPARRRGRIVNIASIAGEIGLPGTVAYSASKGGVVMPPRALAVEWAPYDVRVNAIAPSWFSTKIGDLIHREPGYEERAMRRVPVGRMGRPDELVGAALYLASDASAMVTGHVLAVDGGTLASWPRRLARPLEGLTALGLATFVAAPFCCTLL